MCVCKGKCIIIIIKNELFHVLPTLLLLGLYDEGSFSSNTHMCVYVYFVCVWNLSGYKPPVVRLYCSCFILVFFFFCLATNNTQLQEEQKISFFVCCFQSFLCLFERRKKKILYFIYKRARKSIAHMKINKLFHNFSSFFFFVFLLLPLLVLFFLFFWRLLSTLHTKQPKLPFPHSSL